MRMPKIPAVLKPSRLNEHDIHGDRIELIEPGGENAFVRVRFPAMQIRPADYPVVPSKLQMHLEMGPTRHDRPRERIDVDRNVVSVDREPCALASNLKGTSRPPTGNTASERACLDQRPEAKTQGSVRRVSKSCPLVASGARRIAQLGMQFNLWKPSMQ
jgi:hypothetical protein